MFSTLYIGGCDVLVTFDDVCPTSSGKLLQHLVEQLALIDIWH